MAILLLQLIAPLQSWGTQSRFRIRDTGLEPSKSGVVGMLAAALGRPRSADVRDLASLRMAVRVDREGVLTRDYHTVLDVPKASGAEPGTVVSERYYLADAAFLVGLEGEADLLREVASALRTPRWPLYLGRRSCPPAASVLIPDGFHESGSLEERLRESPSLEQQMEEDSEVRLLLEVEPGSEEARKDGAQRRQDQPKSFQPPSHTARYVVTKVTRITGPASQGGG